MLASMIIRWLGLVVLAAIVAAALMLWRRAVRHPLFLPAGKRKAGPLERWRVACGVLGAALVVAVAVGTWQTVRASYRPSASLSNVTLRVPTRPLDLGSVLPGAVPDSVRFLATLLVLDARASELRPVYVKEFDLQWPRDRRSEDAFQVAGLRGLCVMRVDAVDRESDDPCAGLRVRGGMGIAWEGISGFDGMWNTFDCTGERPLCPIVSHVFSGMGSNPLSVTPHTPEQFSAALAIVPVAQEDPLQTVSIDEFLHWHKADLKERGVTYGEPVTPWYASGAPAGGGRLASRLGWTSWVLLAAAALLAQLFRRRDLATAGMLLGMVLFIAGLDRVVLAYDLSRLEDSAASLDVRFVAASRVPATFFYKPTAALRVAQLSVRPDLPAELRGWLHEVRRQGLNAYLE